MSREKVKGTPRTSIARALHQSALAVFVLSLACLLLLPRSNAQVVDEGTEFMEGKVQTVKTSMWASSTGYVTLPSAVSLGQRPRWKPHTSAPVKGSRFALAIVGLPVDLEQGAQEKALSFLLSQVRADKKANAPVRVGAILIVSAPDAARVLRPAADTGCLSCGFHRVLSGGKRIALVAFGCSGDRPARRELTPGSHPLHPACVNSVRSDGNSVGPDAPQSAA